MGSREKRQAKNAEARAPLIHARREESLRQRVSTGEGFEVGPALPPAKTSKYLEDESSEELLRFYRSHSNRGDTNLLVVSDSDNVSNPTGEPGGGSAVFANLDIAAGKLLCPYLGVLQESPCPAEEGCCYDLRAGPGQVLCARDVKYDIGYLREYGRRRKEGAVQAAVPCPPNYGRYMNTHADRSACNCYFEPFSDGKVGMFVYASRKIYAGQELLVDYGDSFEV